MNRLAALIRSYLTLGVVAAPSVSNLQFSGAMPDPGSLVNYLTSLNNNGSADAQTNFQTSAGASITLSSLQQLIQRLTVGSACTVTLDSAYNIVNNLSGPSAGQTFPFNIITNASTTVATPTLSDTAVTLSGTTTVLGAAMRWYQVTVTQVTTTTGTAVTNGTTFSSLTQVGSTNNYTVALGTNALSPVVGNVIFLNVTAGTLPSGWYPVNKVSSATSFVIAAPSAGTAWTATAATVPGTVIVPLSQYQLGLTGIYSPLITITGMMATVTGTMSV